MKGASIYFRWRDEKNAVSADLPLVLFKEGNNHIAYIPALDLPGYGNTGNEAIESLKIVIDEYFSYAVCKKTLIRDLTAHGWILYK